MLNILTVFMFLSVCAGIYLCIYIVNNGHSNYMRYLAAMVAGMAIYIFGYMIELHSNTMETALLWNDIQYLAIPVLSTLWLVGVLLYIGVLKNSHSWIIYALFVIPLITYIMRWTTNIDHLFYFNYTFQLYGEIGVLGFDKGPWYYVQEVYESIEILFVIIIFWCYSYKVGTDERRRYRLLSLINLSSIAFVYLIIYALKKWPLDYTAIIGPIPLFILSYLISGRDFFEISSLARNRVFYQNNDAMIALNDKNRIIDFNLKAIGFFESVGMKLSNVDLNMFYDQDQMLVHILQSDQTELYHKTFNEVDRYWEVSTNIISGKIESKYVILKTIRDITSEYAAKIHLEQMAKTDELTHLPNRRDFQNRAKKLIEQTNINHTILVMLMFDVDLFKNVNDTFGHQVGDLVLQRVAQEAYGEFRSSDLIARIGGEEFVVILPDISEEKALLCAERYRKKIAEQHMVPNAPDYIITVSVGMAVCRNQMSLDELIQNADSALYKAKNAGRNNVVQYSER